MLRGFVCLLMLLPVKLFAGDSIVFRAMFYNVENLFDTRKDSLTNDDEFQPEALRRWHYKRYRKKLDDISKVIMAVGEGQAPALVGLCEVENDTVMRDLTRRSPLRECGYRYVMTHSADPRGIDVALLYQRDRFRLLTSTAFRIRFADQHRRSRDILYASGRLNCGDTLDVFVVHFPSRLGGRKASDQARRDAAGTVRRLTDSLLTCRLTPRILIMGDMNDTPESPAIRNVLQADAVEHDADPARLYHLLVRQVRSPNYGSYKYKGRWELIDHLIVSGSMLNPSGVFHTSEARADVVRLPFLLHEDLRYGGHQPYRTYNGVRYQGGFSDHLPVSVTFTEYVNW